MWWFSGKSSCSISLEPTMEGENRALKIVTSHVHSCAWCAHAHAQTHITVKTDIFSHRLVIHYRTLTAFFVLFFFDLHTVLQFPEQTPVALHTIWWDFPLWFSVSGIGKLADSIVFTVMIITFRNSYPRHWKCLHGSATEKEYFIGSLFYIKN